jgi:ketosteroid isomerase-like protein
MGVTVADRLTMARAVVEGFAERDVERLVSLFAPDVEFRTRVDVMGQVDFAGHDGARAWLAAVDETYDHFEIVDAEYQLGEGDAVVVSCHLRLRYSGDRYGMARMAYWVFRVNEEQPAVVAFTSYRDHDEALAAAGLSDGGA